MQLKKTTWAIFISLLALFLRLFLAYNGPTEFDEGVYISAAAQYNQAIRQGDWNQILDSTFNNEHPQFNKLVYAIGLFAGKTVLTIPPLGDGLPLKSLPYWHYMLVLRAISAFMGAAAVFLLSLISPLAGFLLAIDTFAIKYSSVVYLEALPAFTNLAAMMAALKSLQAYQDNPARWRKWAGWLALSSLAVGISAASKYVYALVSIAIILVVMTRLWKQKIPAFLGLAVWGFLSLVFFFMLDPVLWHSPVSRLAASIQYHINYTSNERVLDINFPFWQPIQWLLLPITQQPNDPTMFFSFNGNYFVLADTLIFIGALVGLPSFYQKNRPLFIWLGVSLAFLLLWRTKWPQYTMLVLAPFCLSAAYGFNDIRSNLPQFISKLRPKLPAGHS
jgi:hypothetical protein